MKTEKTKTCIREWTAKQFKVSNHWHRNIYVTVSKNGKPLISIIPSMHSIKLMPRETYADKPLW